MSETPRYYILLEGKPSGPFSAHQVRSKVNQGKAIESDYIWPEGSGGWKRISDVLAELPGEEPPPLPDPAVPTSLEIKHPIDLPTTHVQIPPRGIFEPQATASQKNKLMKLGWTTPELLRNLGRDQAFFMIDAFSRDAQTMFAHEHNKRVNAQKRAVGITLCVLLGLFGIWLLVTRMVSQQSYSPPKKLVTVAPSKVPLSRSLSSKSTPLKSPVALTAASPARVPNIITLTKPVSITIPYGVIGLRTGTKLQLLSRTGDKARVRYDGADYDIPISATDLH